jgi:SPP1 gp7 family putative phage head morphogenesis protein
MPDLLLKPVPNKAAIAFLKDKPPVARGIFDRMLPEVQSRMFTVAGIQPVNVLQSLRDRIADLPAGGDWNEIKKDLVSEISPFLGTDEDSLAAAERKAELLLRSHGYQAYSATAYAAIQEQKDVFPFLRYQTAQDDRVRESHAALEGLVLPVDDPFWLTHWGPWDYGCRCPHPVALSRTDVAEIAAEDKTKPADQRSILSPEQRDTINRSGFLIRGPNANVDVRAPRDKGQPGAYNWQPSDLRLGLDDLKKRYDAPTWSAFETFARRARLDPSEGASPTVWDWLEGKPLPTGVARAITAAAVSVARPVLLPEEVAPATPNKAPVSAALDNRTRGPVRHKVATAVALVDKAHDDGVLPAIPVTGKVPGRSNGVYVSRRSGTPVEIGIKGTGPNPIMTTAHELGHFIDHQALDTAGRFASQVSPALAGWRQVVLESAPIQAIRAQLATSSQSRAYFQYLLAPEEIWARAYAQYIATRTGDVAMLAELQAMRALPRLGPMLQWTAEEFAPIAREIDTLFKTKGWIQ